MKIWSFEPVTISRQNNGKYIDIKLEVGMICIVKPVLVTTKKERKNQGRVVKILGFNDNFSPTGTIIRYLDTGRRGMMSPNDLLPLYDDDNIKK